MEALKQILMRCAVQVLRPLNRFLLLRTMGRCRVAAAWEQNPPTTLVQQD